jgi:hypothetical protein
VPALSKCGNSSIRRCDRATRAVAIDALPFPARVVYAHRTDDALTAIHGSPAVFLGQGIALDDLDRPGTTRAVPGPRQDSRRNA